MALLEVGVTKTIWKQSMGAAIKAFQAGDTKTGIAKLSYACWLGARHGVVVDEQTAGRFHKEVVDALNLFGSR